MTMLGEKGLPFVIVFTKIEKTGPVALQATVDNYRKLLLETWEEVPPIFTTSAVKAMGRTEILDYIQPLNEGFTSQRASAESVKPSVSRPAAQRVIKPVTIPVTGSPTDSTAE